MSRRTTSAANNLDALANSELRELLVQHGYPNQPVTNSTRSVLISRLRKSMQESGRGGASKTRHTTSASPSSSAYLARYSSAEEDQSDRESSQKSHSNRTGAATSPSNMPPPPTTATKRRKATQQGSYSFFSPSSTSSVSYGSNNLPTIKVPIQSRSSVYIPPPAVHSSDTEESDSNTAAGTARNPYLSYGRLSGLSFPKRYSPAPQDNHSPSARVPSSYSSNNAASPTNASRLLNETQSGGSSGGEDSPYVSDFTKRLLQFRQEPVDRRATTTSASALPPPNPR